MRTGSESEKKEGTNLITEELKDSDINTRRDGLECHINERMYILILANTSHEQTNHRNECRSLQIIIRRLDMVTTQGSRYQSKKKNR
jgi:hypothetical protein